MDKKTIEGCGGLFKSPAGNILTCGEDREDGCNFKCKRCLKEYKHENKIENKTYNGIEEVKKSIERNLKFEKKKFDNKQNELERKENELKKERRELSDTSMRNMLVRVGMMHAIDIFEGKDDE